MNIYWRRKGESQRGEMGWGGGGGGREEQSVTPTCEGDEEAKEAAPTRLRNRLSSLLEVHRRERKREKEEGKLWGGELMCEAHKSIVCAVMRLLPTTARKHTRSSLPPFSFTGVRRDVRAAASVFARLLLLGSVASGASPTPRRLEILVNEEERTIRQTHTRTPTHMRTHACTLRKGNEGPEPPSAAHSAPPPPPPTHRLRLL